MAFVAPAPRLAGPPYHLSRTQRATSPARSSSFLARRGLLPPAPRTSAASPAARHASSVFLCASSSSSSPFETASSQNAVWEAAYKAHLREHGLQVCRMAQQGHAKLGRGAVFIGGDASAAAVAPRIASIDPATRELRDRGEALPALFVSLDALLGRATGAKDRAELEPVISRVRLYDPMRQFVCVFEVSGVQGADIVTPKHMPELEG